MSGSKAGRQYVVAYSVDAVEDGWPDTEDMRHYHSSDACWGIWRCEDGVPMELIGEDGGEPEDQVLVRNWSWVAEALNRAFAEGVARGAEADAINAWVKAGRPLAGEESEG